MFSVKCKISKYVPETKEKVEVVETFIVEENCDEQTQEGQAEIAKVVKTQIEMFNQQESFNNPDFVPTEFIGIEEILVIHKDDNVDDEDEWDEEDEEDEE